MQQYHESNFRKKVSKGSGGKRIKNRDKKLAHIGGVFSATKVSKEERKAILRARGGNSKVRLKAAAFANVANKEGKIVKAKIIAVVESANPEYVRGNIITKGCVINTDLGKARVTNRVGQDGMVNGKLI
jgi:small subunit ribosomal protein S8e